MKLFRSRASSVEALSTGQQRAVLAVAWGVFPSSRWLSTHGWGVCCQCPECGLDDDAAHSIYGCPAAVDHYEIQNRKLSLQQAVGRPQGQVHPGGANDPGDAPVRRRAVGKQKVLGPILRPECQDRRAFPHGQIIEMINGVVVASGTVRFQAGAPIYTDGSAELAGTVNGVASAAAVQIDRDGE